MSVNLHAIRHAEERAKASLFHTLNSTMLIYSMLLIIIVLGIVLARG
jgi:uncharacterized membrane protein affecting hemolysin expression